MEKAKIEKLKFEIWAIFKNCVWANDTILGQSELPDCSLCKSPNLAKEDTFKRSCKMLQILYLLTFEKRWIFLVYVGKPQ